MKIKECLALNAAPLLLRVAVGVVFLWAGSVKLFTTTTYTGADARTLIELGIVPGTNTNAAPADTTEPREAEGAAGTDGSVENEPADTEQEEPQDDGRVDEQGDAAEEIGEAVDAVAAELEETTGAVTETLEEQVDGIVTAVGDSIAKDLGADAVEARRLYSVALAMHGAAHPEAGKGRLWFEGMSSAGWLGSLAWLAAVTECLGGALILIGLLTRFWSMGMAVTMIVAMAVTTIGPAAQSGGALLGFLPPLMLDEPGGAWVGAWMPWLFQLSMLMGSLALVCTGPGAVSLDRRVLGSKAKSAAAAPKPRGVKGGTHPDRPL